MFPEYRELITQLKSENAHFSALFQRHNDLDQEIQNMEDGIKPSSSTAIEVLKKEKLHLKDKLYGLLRAAEYDIDDGADQQHHHDHSNRADRQHQGADAPHVRIPRCRWTPASPSGC